MSLPQFAQNLEFCSTSFLHFGHVEVVVGLISFSSRRSMPGLELRSACDSSYFATFLIWKPNCVKYTLLASNATDCMLAPFTFVPAQPVPDMLIVYFTSWFPLLTSHKLVPSLVS